MKKLFIHDDGSVTCRQHAGANLSASLEAHPRKKIHWTPMGTWELAPTDYAEQFKQATGIDFDCESCFDFFTQVRQDA